MSSCANKVLIVRDRQSAGGGIHNYYQILDGLISVPHEFVDTGRPQSLGFADPSGLKSTVASALRLVLDHFRLLIKLLHFPALVHLNPGLDIGTRRSLRRDALGLLLAKVFNRRILVFWRGWDNRVCGASDFPGGNRGWLARVYRMADAHVVLSSRFRDDLRRWNFDAPVFVETTVVSDEFFHPKTHGPMRSSGSRFRILFLSRVEEAKGVFELIGAFKLLDSRHAGKFQLTIAGTGSALPDVIKRSRELALSNVEFPGYVTGNGKMEVYARADCFCFLSYTEGMPNAVLEAMASGLPLVSSRAGGLADILENGASGYLVNYDDRAPAGARFSAEEVANRIESLALDPGSCVRMGGHNRDLARRRFAASKVAERLDGIYHEVLEQGAGTVGVSVDPDPCPGEGATRR